jgi:poly(3-hydroxyalkanoate) depolymerase
MNNLKQLLSGTQNTRRANQIKMVQVGSLRLRVVIRPGNGKGVPLLLINGIGANIEMFDPFVEALDPNLEVIRFDIPGVGDSPPPLFPLTLMTLARLTSQMLEQLGYQQVDALGISWGGALAQQFAYDHPRQCRRLILVATSTGAIMVPAHISVLVKMISPERYLHPSYMQAIAPSIYGGRIRSDLSLIQKILHKVRAPSALGYYWQLLGCVGWTSIHWLTCLRQPTLIIAGDDDPLIPIVNARIMARLIPKSILRIIRNGGHLYLLTDAKEAAEIVQAFLSNPS